MEESGFIQDLEIIVLLQAENVKLARSATNKECLLFLRPRFIITLKTCSFNYMGR